MAPLELQPPGNPALASELPPVTVEVASGSADNITSYSATVRRYHKNDRRATEFRVVGRYNLSVKNVNGRLMTRMDLPSENFSDGVARSIINDGVEQISFRRDNLQIEHRVPMRNGQDALPTFDINAAIMGRRIDFQAMKMQLRALNYEIHEDTSKRLLMVEIPSRVLARTSRASQMRNMRMYYDTEHGTLSATQALLVDEHNTSITTTQSILYKEMEGVPIVIGSLTTVKNDYPYRLNVSDRGLPRYNGPQDARVTTMADLQGRISRGEVSAVKVDPLVGDPAEPDNTDIYVERYEDMVLNGVQDSVFRVSR